MHSSDKLMDRTERGYGAGLQNGIERDRTGQNGMDRDYGVGQNGTTEWDWTGAYASVHPLLIGMRYLIR
jgi:hypothetical protein